MVCAGNICRSPMAEALLTHRLSLRGLPAPVAVESAGIHAPEGARADPLARLLMAERGLDLAGHRARQLTPELLADFDLVLVMEEVNKRDVERMHPASRGRVQRLGRFGDFDVPDPYGGTREDFEQALALIERGIGEYERTLWSA